MDMTSLGNHRVIIGVYRSLICRIGTACGEIRLPGLRWTVVLVLNYLGSGFQQPSSRRYLDRQIVVHTAVNNYITSSTSSTSSTFDIPKVSGADRIQQAGV